MSLQDLPSVLGKKSHGVKKLQEPEQLLRALGLDEEESPASSVFCAKYYKRSSDER